MRLSLMCLVFSLLFLNSEAGILTGIGAEGGLSLTSQKWDYKSNTDYAFLMKDWDQRANAGIFFQFFDFKHFNLIVDITYNQKGGLDKQGIQSTIIGSDGSYEIIPGSWIAIWDRIDYISLLPRAKFKYKIGFIEPFFTIGPSFDFETRRTFSEIPPITDFKKFDFSTPYGIGVGMSINPHLYGFFEFLHQPSIIPIYSNSNLDITNDGVKFNIGLMYVL
ncbi:MAG: hypothetical protein WBM07_14975 [Chitinivibrionales bacterium]